jgi:hypothetical protein
MLNGMMPQQGGRFITSAALTVGVGVVLAFVASRGCRSQTAAPAPLRLAPPQEGQEAAPKGKVRLGDVPGLVGLDKPKAPDGAPVPPTEKKPQSWKPNWTFPKYFEQTPPPQTDSKPPAAGQIESKQKPPLMPKKGQAEVTPSVWNGAWQQGEKKLPMFVLKKRGEALTGRYAMNADVILPFEGGQADDDKATFAVDDSFVRLHFRLTMKGKDSAALEAWATSEDYVESLTRAKKMAKTPQQQAALKRILDANAKLIGPPKSFGVFQKQPEE